MNTSLHNNTLTSELEDNYSQSLQPKQKQISTIFRLVSEKPYTCAGLSNITGFGISTITRYLNDMVKLGLITVLFRSRCGITGHKANFYFGNKELSRKEATS